VSNEGLGHRWPIPNSWDRGDGVEGESIFEYINI